jgi:endonuclease G
MASKRRSAALRSNRNGRRTKATPGPAASNKIRPKNGAVTLEAKLTSGTAPAAPVEVDPGRARLIAAAMSAERERLATPLPVVERDDPGRIQTRKSLIYADDTLGFERVIGARDMVQVTFLHQALEAARAVCRLRLRGETPGPVGFGTGFLVAPGVLLTNHHVLETPEAANLALAEFDAELNLNYVLREQRIFNLLPDKLFVTDANLDFTFVAVNSVAHDGTPLADFRWLRLLRESGKAINGEWVTIIQHPGGQTKQIVLRDNEVISLPKEYQARIGPAFLHYTSDTERGSSGSPVLNDQFDVVALHHKAVPEYNADGEPLKRDGKTVWTEAMSDDERSWIANEGVRISAIFSRLDRLAHSEPHAARLLDLIEDGKPRSIFSVFAGGRAAAPETVGEGAELEASVLARRQGRGYKPAFLGFDVPLPKPSKALEKLVQPLEPDAKPKGSRPGELVYTHFSVVMHAKRRMAMFAAVNVDGDQPASPTVDPSWRRDKRILKEAQSLNELYAGNELDKGHLVRRLDPVWGSQSEADDAVIDTYHYTNAAPQEHVFNDGVWGDVEDYILGLAREKQRKISVFTGPVFDDGDIPYRERKPGGPWLIPARFWKVIVYVKPDGTQCATGFLLDQSDRLVDLDEGLTPLRDARKVAAVHQRTVEHIESLTDLDFGALRKLDPLGQLEAAKQVRRIVLPAQIVV